MGAVTLRALLKDESVGEMLRGERSRRAADKTGDEGCRQISDDIGWRFCDSPNCNIVYFSEDGELAFDKSQLKVAVGVKEITGERPLCYCFGHSIASIKQELIATGHCSALDDIRAKMKDPGCRCETENPSGACCLGSVAKGIATAKAELGMTKTTSLARPDSFNSLTTRGETIAKVGAVLSAIAASVCCWLPLLLLALGVSGVGVAAVLDAYRPLFAAITFGFLGAAFYFTYRPRKAAHRGGNDCCDAEPAEGGDCCASTAARRFSAGAVKKLMLWFVAVVAIVFLFFPSYVGVLFSAGDAPSLSAEMRRTVVEIEGMTCEGCAAIAEKAVLDAPGVLAVEVDYHSKRAVVGTDACCPVPKVEILTALKRLGYRGQFTEN